MGIYSKIFQVGKKLVKGAVDKRASGNNQVVKRPPPQKPNYTPVIIGALGVLVITGLIINNNKK
jgi:thiosulfate reductase cytochrome b subunit